jgi:hypothetical protein
MQNIELFRTLLEETYNRQGWAIPAAVTDYQSRILASFLDQPDWQPRPTFAERYLQLKNAAEAVNLGNTCWFARAVFPELGERRGINSSYYVDLGTSCYARAMISMPQPAIQLMYRHFEFLAEAAYTAIRLNQEFREMWDLDR